MQAHENSIVNTVVPLSVSEQIVLLIESTTKNDLDDDSKRHYLIAVIIGCFADLFTLDKITFENNRIKLNNNPKKVNKFLTEIMKEIIFYRGEISIFYILLGMKIKKMAKIKSLIVQDLIDKKLLLREREGIFGQNLYLTNNKNLKFDLYNNMIIGLKRNKQPPKQLLFLLTLLQGINFLPNLFPSKNELDLSRNQLQLFIKNDQIAQLLLQAIQNEIKVSDLENMSKHQGGGFSIGRIF